MFLGFKNPHLAVIDHFSSMGTWKCLATEGGAPPLAPPLTYTRNLACSRAYSASLEGCTRHKPPINLKMTSVSIMAHTI